MSYKDVVVGPDGPYPVGAAVSVVRVDGQLVYQLAGACNCTDTFFGFLSGTFQVGNPASVTTVRGAIISPLLEGGVPLISGRHVFLSEIPGYVTMSVPLSNPSTIVRVGFAISATEIVLNTDVMIANT